MAALLQTLDKNKFNFEFKQNYWCISLPATDYQFYIQCFSPGLLYLEHADGIEEPDRFDWDLVVLNQGNLKHKKHTVTEENPGFDINVTDFRFDLLKDKEYNFFYNKIDNKKFIRLTGFCHINLELKEL